MSLGVNKFTMFIQDYGSPVGFRIAVRHPEWIEGIVSQNGNAYEEGFTGVWDALRTALWKNRTPETETPLAGFFTPDGVKWIYSEGTRNPEKISPDNWIIDLFFLGRPENHRIQLDLFYDYRTNVDQYPRWHEYLRKHQPPTLLVWGANDPDLHPGRWPGVPARREGCASCTCSTPVTSLWKITATRSPFRTVFPRSQGAGKEGSLSGGRDGGRAGRPTSGCSGSKASVRVASRRTPRSDLCRAHMSKS